MSDYDQMGLSPIDDSCEQEGTTETEGSVKWSAWKHEEPVWRPQGQSYKVSRRKDKDDDHNVDGDVGELAHLQRVGCFWVLLALYP